MFGIDNMGHQGKMRHYKAGAGNGNKSDQGGYLLRFNERIAKSVFLQSKHTRIMPIKNAIAKKNQSFQEIQQMTPFQLLTPVLQNVAGRQM